MTDERLKIVKYINDPVYGGIGITQLELDLISTPVFQRLRGLKQVARLNFIFPSAEHSRYVHSIGVLYIMSLMTEQLEKQGMLDPEDVVKMRVAALLHDIGHYPLSHLGEAVYSYCMDREGETEKKPLYYMASFHSKSADHEYLGKYIIWNSGQFWKNTVWIRKKSEKYLPVNVEQEIWCIPSSFIPVWMQTGWIICSGIPIRQE